MDRENLTDEDNRHSQVTFPMTQLSSPHKRVEVAQSGKKKDKKSKEQSALKKILKEAELAKRVLLFLIEKYNLPPPVIVYALYVNSGDVDATIEFLENPCFNEYWTANEDTEILVQGDMDEIIQKHGFEALQERRQFLRQICDEPIGSLSEIEAKLKWNRFATAKTKCNKDFSYLTYPISGNRAAVQFKRPLPHRTLKFRSFCPNLPTDRQNSFSLKKTALHTVAFILSGRERNRK